MMRTTLLLFLLTAVAAAVTAAVTAGCHVSLWAGPLDDPYELNLPGADATPTPVPTPHAMPPP
ncbi:MAG: hypothetical protein ACREQJ_05095 [Candidatus Binatia bacterium]